MKESAVENLSPKRRSLLSRLRPRFSLRAMLAVVTVVCILIPTWILPSERQRRAAEQIDAIGGCWAFVGEDVELNAQIKKDRRWYEHLFKRIDSVQLHLSRYADSNDSIVAWRDLPQLKQLTIIANLGRITGMYTPPNIDWLIKQLAANQQLIELNVIQFRVSDEEMETIRKFQNLERIRLYDCFDITDSGLRMLLDCKKLKKVLINLKGYTHETLKLFRDRGIEFE